MDEHKIRIAGEMAKQAAKSAHHAAKGYSKRIDTSKNLKDAKSNEDLADKDYMKMMHDKHGYDEGERATLENANRLEVKQEREHKLATAAEKIENKMSRTHEALGILGAGKPYGQ